MANASGLEVVTISGYAKGYDYTPGMQFSGPTNHAWNAIKINGSWYLLDSTWGAGYVDGRNFVRKFDEHYFLTPPEEFVYDHFPEDHQWQLLDSPISKEMFENLVYLRPGFFNLGIRDVLIMASLGGMNQGASSSKEYSTATFAQRSGDRYVIYLLPPAPGEYILTVFAKRMNEEGSYLGVMQYNVSASSGSKMVFPETFGDFREKEIYLYTPIMGELKAGLNQTFKLKIPAAEDAAVISGESWHHLTKSGDIFQGDAVPRKGEVSVAARFPGKHEYSTLLRYRGI